MSKELRVEMAYDAPIAAVSGMLADAAFREQVCDAQHARSKSVAITGSTVSIRYEQAVSGVPGFAKKFVGDTIEVHQDEIWSADFTAGDLKLTLPGKPGSLTGTARLAENGTQTIETVTLTATVNVPLVSGKLEDLILSIFKKGLEKEHQVGTRWLAG
ncbi:DUF2505 domain-containing protein [Nocardioides sp. CCNWLW239]|uniref:DUF2505 domain-containing protein n=1 Tax=Nocardioides sp. CCNWLW239 TaxID=3128902 RepID=UPI00301A658B